MGPAPQEDRRRTRKIVGVTSRKPEISPERSRTRPPQPSPFIRTSAAMYGNRGGQGESSTYFFQIKIQMQLYRQAMIPRGATSGRSDRTPNLFHPRTASFVKFASPHGAHPIHTHMIDPVLLVFLEVPLTRSIRWRWTRTKTALSMWQHSLRLPVLVPPL